MNFDIKADDIDTISKSFKKLPHFSNVFSSVIKVKEPFRIALHPEAFNVSVTNFFPENVKTKYEFQLYSVGGPGEQVWISALIENFNELAVMDDFEFKGQVFTVISSKKRSLPVKSYDFSKEYQGWNFIVFPFVNFIQGLSVVKGTYVGRKVIHLSQSSGYGKTRLCFEALKYFGRGIYCVHRSDSTGYPISTPWFSNLILEFKKCTTDDGCLSLCRGFILAAVTNFNDFEGSRNIESFINLFEGKESGLENLRYFGVSPISDSSAFISSVSAICKKCFTMIVDECHELFSHFATSRSGLNLYRALVRALYELRELPFVIIFLGTKSSIGDFVSKSARTISTREYGDDKDNGFQVPLYVFTQSMDAMLTETFSLNYQDIISEPIILNSTAMISSEKFRNLSVRCGRPLWSFIKSFHELYNLAQTKLQSELSLFELTCFILRTGSTVVPQDSLAHKLVMSGMATLLHVDVDGSRCWTEYVPEPILSNVSRNTLLNMRNYAKSIEEYVKRLKIGTFHDSGSAGELVARIVLLRAMDLALIRISGRSFVDPLANVTIISENDLFGQRQSDDNFKEKFSQKCLKIFSNSPLAPFVKSNNFVSKTYFSPMIGITTLKEYLMMMLDIEETEDLYNFGVSDDVLNGLVSLNQFIHIDNPLIINQPYLMHGFARSVGFILPPRAPGVDLVVPVLRADNKMSCVVIQVKNYSTDSFPSNVSEINTKLTIDYLKFLDFSGIGDFEAAPWDDFVRIVIQFREKKEFKKEPDYFSYWIPINSSKSLNEKVKKCNSAWILGLDFFENSLFFGHEGIIKDLNTILSGQRDFLTAIDYPKTVLPTKLQASEVGARFLANSARPMANYQNIMIEDRRLKVDEKSEEAYKVFCGLMKNLEIPENAKMFKNKFAITSKTVLESMESSAMSEYAEPPTESDDSQKSQESYSSRRSKASIETQKSNTSLDSYDSTYSIEFKNTVLNHTRIENSSYTLVASHESKLLELSNLNKTINDEKTEFYNNYIQKRDQALSNYKRNTGAKKRLSPEVELVAEGAVSEESGAGVSEIEHDDGAGVARRQATEISPPSVRSTRNVKPKY